MTVTTLRCIWPPSDSVHIAGLGIVVCVCVMSMFIVSA